MRLRRLIAIFAVGAVGVTIWATPTSWAQNHVTSLKSAHATSSTSDPEFSALEQLAGNIGQLGESSYSSTYADVQISNGILYLYVTGNDSGFLNAVTATDSAGLPYTLEYVTRSSATHAATSQWIANNETTLAGEGIALGWWGPSPADDAVRVALQSPTSAQLTELQSAVDKLLPTQATVAAATYLTAAADVIKAQVPTPSDVVLFPTLLGPGVQASGYNDTSPFDGADSIKRYIPGVTETCTTNFSYNSSSNPSNHKDVTAAHCTGGATGDNWATCATTNNSGQCNYKVGTVTSAYYNNQDFEVIPTSNEGYVWNDSNGSKWSVNGWIDAEVGDYLTVDGQTNGAHYGNYVTSGDGSTCVIYSGHTSCHAIVISTGSNNFCPQGDSGGPVLERESDGYHIYAAGLILGYNNTADGDFCYAQQVYWIRSVTGFLVLWGN
jgi:hypothetical protein